MQLLARKALHQFFWSQKDLMDDNLNPGCTLWPASPMRGNEEDRKVLIDYCRDCILWVEEQGIDPAELADAMIAEAQRRS